MTAKRFEAHCLSEAGPACPVNEDSHAVLRHTGPGGSAMLVAVADGVGGLDLGEDASQAIISAVRAWWDRIDWAQAPEPGLLLQGLAKAVRRANHIILTAATRCGLKMGTTLSALLLTEGEYRLYHIGDSRVYRISGGAVERLTTDHTKTLPAGGRKPPKLKSYLTQCIGAREAFTCQKASGTALPGDVFLVCTDGLYKTLADEAIGQAVQGHPANVDAACRSLVAQALENGETDNVTAAVVQVCL